MSAMSSPDPMVTPIEPVLDRLTSAPGGPVGRSAESLSGRTTSEVGWPQQTGSTRADRGDGLGWPPIDGSRADPDRAAVPRETGSLDVSRGTTSVGRAPENPGAQPPTVVRLASHARPQAEAEPDHDADDYAGSGSHRRFAVAPGRNEASTTDRGGRAQSESLRVEHGGTSTSSPPVRTMPAVRTAAEIASLPTAIGGEQTGGEHETPLAVAAGMALRARGVDRSRSLPRPASTRVMVVANQKGGVGKTTTAVNVAAALALYGARVLLIDLDPQGNASTALGVDHQAGVPSMYEVLVRGTAIADVIQPATGFASLFCAPATIDLSGAEVELVAFVAREQRLRRAIEEHLARADLQGEQRYDYVLIDCPPSLGLLTVNALAAGVEVFIPIQCEYYALEGVSQLVRIVELVKTQLNPSLVVTTVLLTMYDARTRLSSQVADEVRTHFGPAVLATAIPRSVRISEAPSYSQTVMTYDPSSSGALSYLEAAREIAHASARLSSPGTPSSGQKETS